VSDRYLTDAAQDPREIAEFAELLANEGVTSYLEVGSKFGGSLWRVATALPPGSRIVSVDMPGGTKAWKESEASLKACAAELERLGYDVTVIWGDSTDPKVIEQVKALGPYDAMLLDGDHRLDGLVKDWDNYRDIGKIIAFHDVAWFRAATWEGVRIDVPQLWNNLRPQYRSVEFRHDESLKNNGIGVLWRT
jgi:cephalosporin hydroxylase